MIAMLNEAIRCFQVGQSYLREADRLAAFPEDREIIEAVFDRISRLNGKLDELQMKRNTALHPQQKGDANMTALVQFQADEPKESIDLAKVAMITASQLLGDALKTELDPLTREQVQDILDAVDNAIEAIENIGI